MTGEATGVVGGPRRRAAAPWAPAESTLGLVRLPSRLPLAALMAGSGIYHLVAPEFYERIVPRPLGHARFYVYASGVVEVLAAVLLAAPRTRRAGGWVCAALLVAVFPANVQMALDGGARGASGIVGSSAAAWFRLPLQVPLVWWAVAEGRRADRDRPKQARPAEASLS